MMKTQPIHILVITCILLFVSCNSNSPQAPTVPENATLSLKVLQDKIKGGWAGQTIGCTFGGSTEFKFKGTMIQDYQQMVWYDDYIEEIFETDINRFVVTSVLIKGSRSTAMDELVDMIVKKAAH